MCDLSFDQRKEIFEKHCSDTKQESLAFQHNISQPSVSIIAKEFRGHAIHEKSNRPFGTHASGPACVVSNQNYQNPYSSHFFLNDMQPRMLYSQEGGRIRVSASPFAGQPMCAVPVQCHSFRPVHGGWGQQFIFPAGSAEALFAPVAPFACDASNALAACIHRAIHPSSQLSQSPALHRPAPHAESLLDDPSSGALQKEDPPWRAL